MYMTIKDYNSSIAKWDKISQYCRSFYNNFHNLTSKQIVQKLSWIDNHALNDYCGFCHADSVKINNSRNFLVCRKCLLKNPKQLDCAYEIVKILDIIIQLENGEQCMLAFCQDDIKQIYKLSDHLLNKILKLKDKVIFVKQYKLEKY